MATLEEARKAKEMLKERIGAHEGINGIGLTKVGVNWMLQVDVLPECDVTRIPGFENGVSVRVQRLNGMPRAQ